MVQAPEGELVEDAVYILFIVHTNEFPYGYLTRVASTHFIKFSLRLSVQAVLCFKTSKVGKQKLKCCAMGPDSARLVFRADTQRKFRCFILISDIYPFPDSPHSSRQLGPC